MSLRNSAIANHLQYLTVRFQFRSKIPQKEGSMFKRILIGIFMTLLTGCMTLGPDYQRPDIDMPDSWRFEEKEAKALANVAWWEQFNDPVLNGLVETALKENKDILIATARVEEFFGRYFAVRGDRFPLIDASGSAYRQGVSEEGPTPIPSGTDTTYDYYEAFLGGSGSSISGENSVVPPSPPALN
jgi:outer membrane protein, multidrug efflux system